MRRLILHMGTSIDGFVATTDGSRAGAHLMGRVTYEDMATVWPSSSSDYAAPMNEIPKVVFSKTLERADWPEARIASGDLDDEVAELKAEEGGHLLAHVYVPPELESG